MTSMLVVDDSNLIRSRIARVVAGGTLPDLQIVALARDGAEAMQACRRFRPAVVTMDLTMPGMDGIACIEAMVAAHPQVLILVVSALADKATAINALKKGAHGFVCKPFSDATLVASLKELLACGVAQS